VPRSPLCANLSRDSFATRMGSPGSVPRSPLHAVLSPNSPRQQTPGKPAFATPAHIGPTSKPAPATPAHISPPRVVSPNSASKPAAVTTTAHIGPTLVVSPNSTTKPAITTPARTALRPRAKSSPWACAPSQQCAPGGRGVDCSPSVAARTAGGALGSHTVHAVEAVLRRATDGIMKLAEVVEALPGLGRISLLALCKVCPQRIAVGPSADGSDLALRLRGPAALASSSRGRDGLVMSTPPRPTAQPKSASAQCVSPPAPAASSARRGLGQALAAVSTVAPPPALRDHLPFRASSSLLSPDAFLYAAAGARFRTPPSPPLLTIPLAEPPLCATVDALFPTPLSPAPPDTSPATSLPELPSEPAAAVSPMPGFLAPLAVTPAEPPRPPSELSAVFSPLVASTIAAAPTIAAAAIAPIFTATPIAAAALSAAPLAAAVSTAGREQTPLRSETARALAVQRVEASPVLVSLVLMPPSRTPSPAALHTLHPAQADEGELHTGASAVHTGDGAVHTGASAVHIGASAVHTGDGAVHTGNLAVHNGNLAVHGLTLLLTRAQADEGELYSPSHENANGYWQDAVAVTDSLRGAVTSATSAPAAAKPPTAGASAAFANFTAFSPAAAAATATFTASSPATAEPTTVKPPAAGTSHSCTAIPASATIAPGAASRLTLLDIRNEADPTTPLVPPPPLELPSPVHTGASAVHTGATAFHTGDGAVHTGASAVHTSGGAVHTDDFAVDTGASAVHTDDCAVHIGDCAVHIGSSALGSPATPDWLRQAVHNGNLAVHTGASAVHTGFSAPGSPPATPDWLRQAARFLVEARVNPNTVEGTVGGGNTGGSTVGGVNTGGGTVGGGTVGGGNTGGGTVGGGTVGGGNTGNFVVHTGASAVHTGASAVHTGDGAVQTGNFAVHTGDGAVNTGAPGVHTSDGAVHTGGGNTGGVRAAALREGGATQLLPPVLLAVGVWALLLLAFAPAPLWGQRYQSKGIVVEQSRQLTPQEGIVAHLENRRFGGHIHTDTMHVGRGDTDQTSIGFGPDEWSPVDSAPISEEESISVAVESISVSAPEEASISVTADSISKEESISVAVDSIFISAPDEELVSVFESESTSISTTEQQSISVSETIPVSASIPVSAPDDSISFAAKSLSVAESASMSVSSAEQQSISVSNSVSVSASIPVSAPEEGSISVAESASIWVSELESSLVSESRPTSDAGSESISVQLESISVQSESISVQLPSALPPVCDPSSGLGTSWIDDFDAEPLSAHEGRALSPQGVGPVAVPLAVSQGYSQTDRGNSGLGKAGRPTEDSESEPLAVSQGHAQSDSGDSNLGTARRPMEDVEADPLSAQEGRALPAILLLALAALSGWLLGVRLAAPSGIGPVAAAPAVNEGGTLPQRARAAVGAALGVGRGGSEGGLEDGELMERGMSDGDEDCHEAEVRFIFIYIYIYVYIYIYMLECFIYILERGVAGLEGV